MGRRPWKSRFDLVFRFCHPLIFSIVVLLLSCQFGIGAAVEEGQTNSNGEDFTATAILASVGLVACGFTIIAMCSVAWFRRQFRKLCPPDPPTDDPIAEFADSPSAIRPFPTFPRDSYGTMMTLDPSNLADDHPITIEPLPSIQAMSTTTTRYYVSETGDARLSFDSLNYGIEGIARPTIDVSEDDASISAHDWFTNPSLEFPRNNVSFIQEVGSGWFGLVIESEARDIMPYPRRCRVMVKLLREEANEREQMKFLDEARVYRDSNHKNILKLLGHSILSTPFLLILEHYPKGDLKKYLLENSKGTQLLDSQGASIRNKMALDVANGLDWMHSNGFAHQDLAARNCMIGDSGQIVIGDYSLGKQNYREDYYWSRDVAVPIRWTAPETLHTSPTVIKTLKITSAANVWTYGIVLWEICELGKFPYAELSDEEVLARVISDKNYTMKQPSIVNLPYVTFRDKMSKILTACWHPIPSNRPTISEVVQLLSVPL